MQGEYMIARLLRRGRAVQPAIRKIEPSKEVQAVEKRDAAEAIAFRLRALIPCSTDKMTYVGVPCGGNVLTRCRCRRVAPKRAEEPPTNTHNTQQYSHSQS